MDFADPALIEALQALLPRERRILEMRAQGKTFDEIGDAFGYSRAQAFRLAQIARQKLNARLKRQAGAARDSRTK